jgi:hypothetical protein
LGKPGLLAARARCYRAGSSRLRQVHRGLEVQHVAQRDGGFQVSHAVAALMISEPWLRVCVRCCGRSGEACQGPRHSASG